MKNGICDDLNGWQRIQKIEGNQTPACNAGNFKPSSLITNWVLIWE
jgi:hypothetical protein